MEENNSDVSQRIYNDDDNVSTTSSGSGLHHHHSHHESTLPPITTLLQDLQTVKAQLDKVSQVLLSKNPLLHIVVLFAGDYKVRLYAEEVQERFLSNGINCFTQLTTSALQYIKPENLQEIITSSTADYLIVIGDKNMKHKTCQAKKSGKLCEMKVRYVL